MPWRPPRAKTCAPSAVADFRWLIPTMPTSTPSPIFAPRSTSIGMTWSCPATRLLAVGPRILREGSPDVGDSQDRERKLAQLEASSERYVAFWGIISLVASFVLGWPALLAWVGLAWWMQQFCQGMRGKAPNHPRPKVCHSKKSNRRCRD